MNTITAPTLDQLTTTIDTLTQAGGGDTVLGDLRIDVRFRRSYERGTDTLVHIVHTTRTKHLRMRTTTRVIPWTVEYHLAYNPADHADIAEWHAAILDALTAGPDA